MPAHLIYRRPTYAENHALMRRILPVAIWALMSIRAHCRLAIVSFFAAAHAAAC